MSGFALSEYHVPKCGMPKQILGGTMPKASGKYTSHLGQVEKQAAKTPGPGHFDLLKFDAKAWQSRGGKFVKCARDKGQKMNKTPACSHYQVDAAKDAVLPKTPGGKLSKAPRGSHLEDCAALRSSLVPAPGKYDAKDQRKIFVPTFYSNKNVSRSARRPNSPGPGHYKVTHDLTEHRVPSWTQDKQPVKTFVDVLKQDKAKIPAPGHCGIPDSKYLDQQGARKHGKLVLHSWDTGPDMMSADNFTEKFVDH